MLIPVGLKRPVLGPNDEVGIGLPHIGKLYGILIVVGNEQAMRVCALLGYAHLAARSGIVDIELMGCIGETERRIDGDGVLNGRYVEHARASIDKLRHGHSEEGMHLSRAVELSATDVAQEQTVVGAAGFKTVFHVGDIETLSLDDHVVQIVIAYLAVFEAIGIDIPV